MVDVLVQVFDRGEVKRVVVPVEDECFAPEQICWKTVACIKAAVVLELPFTMMIEMQIKYGLRPEDKDRLREMYGGQDGGDGRRPLTEAGEQIATPVTSVTGSQ